MWATAMGRKPAILLGSVIYGVTTLAVIWQHGYTATLLLRFCTGIGIGGLMPNTIALNSELSPKRLRATLVVFEERSLHRHHPGQQRPGAAVRLAAADTAGRHCSWWAARYRCWWQPAFTLRCRSR